MFTKIQLNIGFYDPRWYEKNSLYCHLTDYNPPLSSSGVLDSPPPTTTTSLPLQCFVPPTKWARPGSSGNVRKQWKLQSKSSQTRPALPLPQFENIFVTFPSLTPNMKYGKYKKKSLTPPLGVMVATCAIRRWRSPQTRIRPPPPALSSFSLFGLLISTGTSDQRCFIQSLIEILFESLSF